MSAHRSLGGSPACWGCPSGVCVSTGGAVVAAPALSVGATSLVGVDADEASLHAVLGRSENDAGPVVVGALEGVAAVPSMCFLSRSLAGGTAKTREQQKKKRLSATDVRVQQGALVPV